ncbi:MAG: hypothetical protein IPI58_08735 [Alphaproteobacteria bacterium]|nr:MAG: hypothetical protein IPI58_08735 [Alphaproteobacteria bacterium]
MMAIVKHIKTIWHSKHRGLQIMAFGFLLALPATLCAMLLALIIPHIGSAYISEPLRVVMLFGGAVLVIGTGISACGLLIGWWDMFNGFLGLFSRRKKGE